MVGGGGGGAAVVIEAVKSRIGSASEGLMHCRWIDVYIYQMEGSGRWLSHSARLGPGPSRLQEIHINIDSHEDILPTVV